MLEMELFKPDGVGIEHVPMPHPLSPIRGTSCPYQSYRDLRVWHTAMDLVDTIYDLTERFPRKEQYGLSQQIQRAAVSVPSNLAEGQGRGYTIGKHGERPKEYLRFISIAQGSLAEVQTQLEIAARRGYLTQDELESALRLSVSVRKQLYALRNSLERRGGPASSQLAELESEQDTEDEEAANDTWENDFPE